MPHLFHGIEAQVGDRVTDMATNQSGRIVNVDDNDCRITVDFGTYRMTGPSMWFEKAA